MDKYQSAWSRAIPMREQLHIMRRLLGYTKPYKKQFGGALLAAAALAGVNVLLPWILQDYMDRYLTNKSATTNIILGFAGLYALGTLLKALVQFLQTFLFAMGSERGMEDVRRELFAKLHTLGMRYFDQTPAGSIVSRVTNDTMTMTDFWNMILSVIVGLFSIVSSFVTMLVVNARIAGWSRRFCRFCC